MFSNENANGLCGESVVNDSYIMVCFVHSHKLNHANPQALHFSLEIIVINIPTPYDGLIYSFHDDVFKIWPTTFWLTGTEIFRFVLNISLNTTTAVPARLSKVCNAIHKHSILHLLIPDVVCQHNIEFNMLFDKLLTV